MSQYCWLYTPKFQHASVMLPRVRLSSTKFTFHLMLLLLGHQTLPFIKCFSLVTKYLTERARDSTISIQKSGRLNADRPNNSYPTKPLLKSDQRSTLKD